MKKLIIVLSILVVLGLVALFAAGYFLGNVPVVSKLMGTNKAVDLGVKITIDSANQGLKDMRMPTTSQELEALAKNPQSFRTIKTSLTQEEVSSLLALGEIPNFPLKLTQVKFNPDGTAESSGVLNTGELKTFLRNNGVSSDVIDKVDDYVKVEGWVNYYAKGTFRIDNNKVALNMSSVQIGKISVPGDLVSNNSAAVGDYVSKSLVRNGFNVRKMAVSGGKLEMDADRPLAAMKPWLKFVQQK